MQAGANVLAGLTPVQGTGGCGARQRNAATGGAAKGMPLKTFSPSISVPATAPNSVRTVARSAAAEGSKDPRRTATRTNPTGNDAPPMTLPCKFRRLTISGEVSRANSPKESHSLSSTAQKCCTTTGRNRRMPAARRLGAERPQSAYRASMWDKWHKGRVSHILSHLREKRQASAV